MHSLEFINSHESPVPEKLREISQDDNDLFTAKIILIGDSTVGKTSLIYRFKQDSYLSDPVLTVGLELSAKKVQVENEEINLHIWDSAGQERYRSMTYHFYKGVSGILLVFDSSNRQSLNNIENWINQVRKHAPENVSMVLVGNKCDIEKKDIEDNKIKYFCEKYNLKYFECSAKSGKNVKEIFKFLAQNIYIKINDGNFNKNRNSNQGKDDSGSMIIKLDKKMKKKMLETEREKKSCC